MEHIGTGAMEPERNSEEIRLQARDMNMQGAMLLRAGRLEQARAKLDQAIELCPTLADSYKNYGDLYMAQQKYRDAKNSYRKALLVEKSGLLYFLYGNACFMNDEPNEGLESYSRAIYEGYDGAEMMFFMGMAWEQMHDDDMALRYFQKACIKDPSRPDYMVKKIGVLVRLKEYERAGEAAQELLIKAPEAFDGYHIRTQLLILQERYAEAVDSARAASQRFPEDAELMHDYARALALAERNEEALSLVRSAAKMKYFDRVQHSFVLLEGQICAQSGQWERAKECCRWCIEREAQLGFDGEANFMLLNLYLAEENYEEALKQAQRIVQKNEADAYYYAALYYRPFCMKRLGRSREAVQTYKEAGALYRLATLSDPSALDLYLYRAMCLKELEDYEGAIKLLDFVEGLNNQIAEVYMLRADIYGSQGNKALAEQELAQACKLKPRLGVNERLRVSERKRDGRETAGL